MSRFYKSNQYGPTVVRRGRDGFTPTPKWVSGFSLVELVVTLSIVTTLITAIVMSQSTYTDGAALVNLADELSLTIAQAQAYGIAVRQLAPDSGDFTASYGITVKDTSGVDNTSYLFFADRDDDGNYYYNGEWTCPTGGASECLEKKDISRGNYISMICVVHSSGPEECDNISRVDISFVRPQTEAEIVFSSDNGSLYAPLDVVGARIEMMSPKGAVKSVIVYRTGQISVQ